MKRSLVLGAMVLALLVPARGLAAPEGQMTWALHFSLTPSLFEPAETPGVVSPFMVLYALHDALVKPPEDHGRRNRLAVRERPQARAERLMR